MDVPAITSWLDIGTPFSQNEGDEERIHYEDSATSLVDQIARTADEISHKENGKRTAGQRVDWKWSYLEEGRPELLALKKLSAVGRVMGYQSVTTKEVADRQSRWRRGHSHEQSGDLQDSRKASRRFLLRRFWNGANGFWGKRGDRGAVAYSLSWGSSFSISERLTA
jgi:hypothetical protein